MYDMEKKKRLEKEAKRYELDAEIMRLTALEEETEVKLNKLNNDNADLRDTNMRLKSVSHRNSNLLACIVCSSSIAARSFSRIHKIVVYH